MRDCDPSLAVLLAGRSVPLISTDFYTLTLADTTVITWTSNPRKLTWDLVTYLAGVDGAPFIKRGKWNVEKTLQIPELEVTLNCNNAPALGGPLNLKTEIHNGLLTGATWRLEQAFMTKADPTTVVGTILTFEGDSGPITLNGSTSVIKVRGANNSLVMEAPRNIYQLGCIHTLYDANCTLLKGSFTTSYAAGASPTNRLITWAAVPGTPGRYSLGIISFTSGVCNKQSRFVRFADASGIVPVFPFYNVPSPGDTFDISEGCDKTMARCTALANLQHFRGFPFTPDATQAV